MRARLTASAALLAVAAAACSPSAGSPDASAPPAAATAPAAVTSPIGALPRLVFFMNPNGAPCQLQDRVLREMGADLNGRASLVYYRTTEPADLPQFGRYGIRSLPMLVVTDATGAEVRRATPGIHSPDEIRRLLATP